MKQRIGSNAPARRGSTIAAIVGLLVLLTSGAPAFAQATYKVGDRVEVQLSGEWVKAVVRKVESNGSVFVRFDGYQSDALSWPQFMRPAQPAAPAGTRPPAGGQTQNQPNNEPRRNDPPQGANGGNKYGTRDPRTCTDKTAPARGAISAALAAQYVICEREKINGPYLYLVENVRAQVGTGRPYNPNMDLNVPEIDVRFPLYPIRGSLVGYQCYEVNPNFTVSAPGRNCNRTNEPEAKGFCYKTTFAEWRCHMADLSNKNENWSQGVAPPRP